ncbi:MAG: hypothetical protein ACREDH_05930, partial [Methylocella sp.]
EEVAVWRGFTLEANGALAGVLSLRRQNSAAKKMKSIHNGKSDTAAARLRMSGSRASRQQRQQR